MSGGARVVVMVLEGSRTVARLPLRERPERLVVLEGVAGRPWAVVRQAAP